MITNAILNLVFGIFDKIFALLPIPSAPDWATDVIEFICEWVGRGIRLFSWVFPQAVYGQMIDIIVGLMLVRFTYDLFVKFHIFKVSPVS